MSTVAVDQTHSAPRPVVQPAGTARQVRTLYVRLIRQQIGAVETYINLLLGLSSSRYTRAPSGAPRPSSDSRARASLPSSSR